MMTSERDLWESQANQMTLDCLYEFIGGEPHNLLLFLKKNYHYVLMLLVGGKGNDWMSAFVSGGGGRRGATAAANQTDKGQDD